MTERAFAKPPLRATLIKELREVVRDGRFWIVAGMVALLCVVALAFGFRQHAKVAGERAAAEQAAGEHWRSQGEKNPHVAAHYGTHVFKPPSALAFVDPGVDPFVGQSIKLVAHERNAVRGAAAQDATSLARFGGLTIASVLQLLVPLLIIGLGFSAWTAERERGTLRLLAASGVSPRRLLAGKAAGLLVALGVLALPAVTLGAAVSASSSTSFVPLGRAFALAGVYLLYFAVFVALTLGVSAAARSSRAALVALLGVWVVSSLVVPRAAADVAALAAPAVTPTTASEQVRRSVETGIPGGPEREARVTELTDTLLEREGFLGAETLMDPALLSSIELQAESQWEREVIDHHFEAWADAIEKQDRIVQWASALSPAVAVRSLSMALSGTDYAHHRHFADRAELYRRALVDMLNRELGDKGGDDVWSYRAGRETWERAPKFNYETPALGWALRAQATSLAWLLAWCVVAAAFAFRAAVRIRVI